MIYVWGNRSSYGFVCFLISLLSLVLASCGGGGGGGNGSGGGSGNSANGTFTLVTPTVEAVATVGQETYPLVQATGTVTGASGTVFIFVDVSNAETVETAFVTINGTTGTLELLTVDPLTLQAGSYTERIPVRVCADQNCNRHLSGSPTTLTFNFDVINDADGDGIRDEDDPDDDNDNVADIDDDQPFNPEVSANNTTVQFNITGSGRVAVNGIELQCDGSCSTSHSGIDEFFSVDIQAQASDNFAFSLEDIHPECSLFDRSISYPGDGWTDYTTSCFIDTQHIKVLEINLDFVEDPHFTVNISADSNGAVLEGLGRIECKDSCAAKVYTNDVDTVALIPVPRPGFQFSSWGGACDGAGACELTMAPGDSTSLTASFSGTDSVVDLCPDTLPTVVDGEGEDRLNFISDYIPLCSGHILYGDTQANSIIWRDVINQVTVAQYALDYAPAELALDEENKLLYVTHGEEPAVSRVDLTTSEVIRFFVESGARTAAVSPDGDLFLSVAVFDPVIESLPNKVLDSQLAILEAEQDAIWGDHMFYHDMTDRLVTNLSQYAFDTETKSLEDLGLATPGGSSYCDVAISPDGVHGAFPCGNGGDGDTIFDFSFEDPSVFWGEWETGFFPRGATFSPSSLYAFLTNGSEYQLFSTSDHTLIRSYDNGPCDSFQGSRSDLEVSTDGGVLLGLNHCDFTMDTAYTVVSWHLYDTNVAP